jgi:predicted HNH restriction endonuclease
MTELSAKQLYRKEYYLKNKEKHLAVTRARYELKKEALLEYQRNYRKENLELVTTKTRNKRKTRLLEAIALLGGKCSWCKGVFEPCVYDFHHTNPEDKDFTIGENMLVSKERFLNEVSKCILLCANCHRMEHNKND